MNKTLIYRLSFVLSFIVIILLVWNGCNQRAELSAFKHQIQKFNLDDQVFIETEDENGQKVIEQNQIILSQKEAIANNLLQIEELKKVQSKVVIKTLTKIDSVFIPFDNSYQDENFWDNDEFIYLEDSSFLVMINDSTFVNIDTIRKQYNKSPEIIYVPKAFSLSDNFYSVSGNIFKSGVLIDSLRFNNELSLTIGMKSQGFLKKPTPIVLAKNSNPFVQTSSMQNIIIKNDLKWYDKKATWFTVGVLSGLTTGILLNNK